MGVGLRVEIRVLTEWVKFDLAKDARLIREKDFLIIPGTLVTFIQQSWKDIIHLWMDSPENIRSDCEVLGMGEEGSGTGIGIVLDHIHERVNNKPENLWCKILMGDGRVRWVNEHHLRGSERPGRWSPFKW